jgi:hypothetical protein
LALSGGQQDAAVADLGVVPLGEAADDLVGADRFCSGLDLGASGVGPAEADVVGDRGPAT